ncbi:MAG TPA: L-seryl-tRNA(Sec) selenium transferase [Actinomycetota bacterium]|nr:L-seryl-tRNA(Sec) selenium transferase [Actinomycetota bacterium]
MADKRDPRRSLPQVEKTVRQLGDFGGVPRPMVVEAARGVTDSLRRRAKSGGGVPDEAEVLDAVRMRVEQLRESLLRPVVNATGVILHTNLGRAPMSADAARAAAEVAARYCTLEYEVPTGRRGDRHSHVEPMLATLMGAEAALVVNNCAAAVLLVCSALAAGREVVISRGELIEIGGGFRIPEVLAQSGAVLREVGTTNRTRTGDYAKAAGERTAMILSVHPSNYKVVGFTESPPLADLATVARKARVPLVYDAGSGLVSGELASEPVVPEVLKSGADLVCFSGDKLLGGPQAGIVCGRRKLVAQLRKHPLLRALRADKMQIAALAATVAHYLRGETDEVPVRRMLSRDYDSLLKRSRRLAARVVKSGLGAEVVEGESVAGGGSLPGHGIASPVVRVSLSGTPAATLASHLRAGEPPVIARVEGGSLVLDLRTVLDDEDDVVARAVASLAQ